jgi:hypothetical protein
MCLNTISLWILYAKILEMQFLYHVHNLKRNIFSLQKNEFGSCYGTMEKVDINVLLNEFETMLYVYANPCFATPWWESKARHNV